MKWLNLDDRYFQVKYQTELFNKCPIKSGVPQGSVLAPTLCQIVTSDLPIDESTIAATFADDTAILASHHDPIKASEMLPSALDLMQCWLQRWRIKVNQSKSAQINFTTRHVICPQVTLNNQSIPVDNDVKYLGMHLDKRLTWKKHLATKWKQLDLKLKQMSWLLGHKSQLSLHNKLILYKVIIKPAWTYGKQLWGCARNSNINLNQRVQRK